MKGSGGPNTNKQVPEKLSSRPWMQRPMRVQKAEFERAKLLQEASSLIAWGTKMGLIK